MISANLVKELREKTGAGMLDCKKALEATNGNLEAAADWLREKGILKAAKKADRIAAEGLASVMVDNNTAVIVEVNSETDFVAKNEEFLSLVKAISNAILNSDVSDVESALQLPTEAGSVEQLIIEKTAKIGEKLSLRRFGKVAKTNNQNFGVYIHMGGKIAVLTVVENADAEVAKDVAMHAAAMRPLYVSRNEVSEEIIAHEREVLKEQAINEGKPADIAEKMVEGRIQKFYKEICLEEQPFVKDQDVTVSAFVKNHGGKILNMIRYEVGEGMQKKEDNFAEEVMIQVNLK